MVVLVLEEMLEAVMVVVAEIQAGELPYNKSPQSDGFAAAGLNRYVAR